MKSADNQRGYTIVELLTVIGIISILTSLSISVFSDSLTSAKAAVCQANRRNIKAELSYAILLDSADPELMFPQVAARYTCPSEGTYSLEYDDIEYAITITCSEHGSALGPAPTGPTAVTKEYLKSINETLKSSGIISSSTIDSTMTDTLTTGDSSKKAQLILALKDAGLDIEKMNMKSWAVEFKSYVVGFDGKGNPIKRSFPVSIYWTTADLNQCENGDRVIFMKYNLDDYGAYDTSGNEVVNQYKNFFSVWECNVVEVAASSVSATDDYIKIDLGKGGLKEIKYNGTPDKTNKDSVYEQYKRVVSASLSGIDYGEP